MVATVRQESQDEPLVVTEYDQSAPLPRPPAAAADQLERSGMSRGVSASSARRAGGGSVVRVRPCTAESAKNALNSSKFSVECLFEGLHPMYPPTNMENQHGPHCNTFLRSFEPLFWYYRCLGLLNVAVDTDECFQITVTSTVVYVIYFFVHMSGFLHFIKGMMDCVRHVQHGGMALFDAMVHTHLAGTIHLITVGTAVITLYHVRAFPAFFNKIQETVTEMSSLPTTNGVLRSQRRLALITIGLLIPMMVLWCACAALAVFNDRKTTDLAIFNPWWSYVYIPVMMSNLALETFSFTFYLFFGMLIARYVVCIGEAMRRLEGIVSAHQVKHLHRMHVQIVTAQRLLLNIFGTHVLIGMGFATVVVVYVVFHSVEVYELMARGTPSLVMLPILVPHVWLLLVSWMHLYIPCYVSDMARDQFCEIINLLAQIETNDDSSLEKAISRYQQQITCDVA
ncbi:uncharacterized protein LOC122377970 isoform X2 [Amphibalanus amphitrite]|uniref:uncharacterized protein LOC122377970 isoform X2 n=1 Tax=Amphibalanus amphitrite TaxID=1232801 RepID=UPI001C926A8A|nr:uncharacterized protein LOC122377970 isoform X2 [Amphibalanus amphitrite]